MKKYIILIVIVFGIVAIVSYNITMNNVKTREIDNDNYPYESIYNKAILGKDFASIINKSLDSNEKNEVEKDSNGIYINNDENSIIIQIKFLDNDSIFSAEEIYKNQVSKFIQLYGNQYFKCVKIEYHNKTKLVKYLYFEET